MTILTRIFLTFSLLSPQLIFCATINFPQEAKEWFFNTNSPNTKELRKFNIKDFGAQPSSQIPQTGAIQKAIDAAAENGGVVVIPEGEFLSGALFFKPKTHLYLAENAILKGSDDISDFPVVPTRIEGRSINYFPALVNADKCDGFTISGKGTIDGNGLRYWKSFWLRRKVNPNCTNIEELRPRLLFISNSKNVWVSGITLQNSPFWTSHYYKCKFIKINGLKITSPAKPVPAPSTDAIDIDACENVHIQNCYMTVNDDAIALKGGKGPYADKQPENGANKNILIENCDFGYCHSTLTLGSEAIFCENIILRNSTFNGASRILWLKMRPDTPQIYKNVQIENLKGESYNFILMRPWTQFFDLKGRQDKPKSLAENIHVENIDIKCKIFFNVEESTDYDFDNFTFKNIKATAETLSKDPKVLKKFNLENFDFKGKEKKTASPQ